MTKERRGELLRAAARQIDEVPVTVDEGAIFWDVEPLTCGELRELLSLVSTCSSCCHFRLSHASAIHPLCQHQESPILSLGAQNPETFGCTLWEPVETETKGA